jgi:hypothetical protein
MGFIQALAERFVQHFVSADSTDRSRERPAAGETSRQVLEMTSIEQRADVGTAGAAA